jgi:hypothetical protein
VRVARGVFCILAHAAAIDLLKQLDLLYNVHAQCVHKMYTCNACMKVKWRPVKECKYGDILGTGSNL